MAFNRSTAVNVHLALAAFFLPFALMFLVTGMLYTISIKGSSTARQETIALSAPLEAELAPLVAVASKALADLGVDEPSGAASVRRVGSTFQLDWGGVARDISLKPTDNPGEATLTINEASPYRRLVQLHKAKGNAFAKAVSIAWAVGLAAIFVSGLAMVWAAPRHRKLALASGGLGMALFVAYYFFG